MSLFYEKSIKSGIRSLDEQESRHCLQVLRYSVGDTIRILDGMGSLYEARIAKASKKSCDFEILSESRSESKPFSVHLGISPTKNVDRMEWMVEKLGELGVDEITFLLTKNGERSRLRLDRLEKKAISAMKQSGNKFLMRLNDLTPFDEFIQKTNNTAGYIAHLGPDTKYLSQILTPGADVCLLIGPEGDFNPDEISIALHNGFLPASLGTPTLRTETAGLLACHFVNMINSY